MRSITMRDVIEMDAQSIDEAAEQCITNMIREELHGTAIIVLSLPEYDGMSAEYLLSQPLEVIEDYINDVVEEVVS
jgi:hypothetical protein